MKVFNTCRSGLGALCSVKLLCLATVALTAIQAATARPHKLRVSDAAQAAELKSRGARLLADYGSFKLFETDDPALSAAKLNRVEVADDWDFIELNAGHLDTRAPGVVAQLKAVVPSAGSRLHNDDANGER